MTAKESGVKEPIVWDSPKQADPAVQKRLQRILDTGEVKPSEPRTTGDTVGNTSRQ
jgi:hypothetical protein